MVMVFTCSFCELQIPEIPEMNSQEHVILELLVWTAKGWWLFTICLLLLFQVMPCNVM